MGPQTAALLTAASIALAGCATDRTADDQTADGQTGADAGQVVDVVDFAFEPDDVTVPVGTTVEWTYTDGSSKHTVTFDDGEESGDLESGDTYARTFDEAGAYAYVCFYHPHMTGAVTVAE